MGCFKYCNDFENIGNTDRVSLKVLYMLFNTEATDCVEVSVKHTRGILVRERKLWNMRSFNTVQDFLKFLLSVETIRKYFYK